MEPTLKQSGSRGQMTIEFALLFPVMLMIALIACNSILFLSECASFDRIFRESVCVFAPSPASEETTGQICAHIEEALAQFNERDYLSCSVSASEDQGRASDHHECRQLQTRSIRMTKQALRKILICAFGFGLCLCLMLAINHVASPALADGPGVSGSAASASDSLSKEQVIELVNGFDETDGSCKELMTNGFDLSLESSLPDSFEQECLDAHAFSTVYSSGEVIGCVFEGERDRARAHCEEALAHKGWQALSGNNEYASNFYKATGRYHQLVLQYFTTQERTLVVITITEREQS